MTQASRLRRLVAALSLAATLMILHAPSASATTSEPRSSSVPNRICPIEWRRGPWFVKKLIKCAVAHWSVPGGSQMALYVAWRESKYNPRAYNSSGAEGVYQHMRYLWPRRASNFGFMGWSAFNARANVIVTMRMVHCGGWGPWGL